MDRYRVWHVALTTTLYFSVNHLSYTRHDAETFHSREAAEAFMIKRYLATSIKYFGIEDAESRIYDVFDAQQEIYLLATAFKKSDAPLAMAIRKREEGGA